MGYTVVVPTVGRESLRGTLSALLAALGGAAPAPHEIIVVDDRPVPGAPLPLPDTGESDLRVLRSGGRGPAAARNTGWRAAATEWIAFLDDDVVPGPRWPERLAADLADLPPEVAGSQGRVVVPRPEGRRPTDGERGTIALETAEWITADMAYRRGVLAEVGGFDERFHRAYREDADLALRVLDTGRVLVRGDREVTHPARPDGFWASVRAQAGNADDVLMRRLHGPSWRSRAGEGRGRLREHVLTTAAAALTLTAAPRPLATARVRKAATRPARLPFAASATAPVRPSTHGSAPWRRTATRPTRIPFAASATAPVRSAAHGSGPWRRAAARRGGGPSAGQGTALVRTVARPGFGGSGRRGRPAAGKVVAVAAGAAWAALTVRFAAERIRPGPRTPGEIVRMAVTSAVIPPAAVRHRVRGLLLHGRARPWAGPRVVLFDRDDTLIRDVPYNGDPARVEPMPGARRALERLRRHGVRIGVVSNQSGVAKGRITAGDVRRVNARVEELLGRIDVWEFCPHDGGDGCGCRKPAPGMIERAARRLGALPSEIAVIGDIGRDVEAAAAAGARGILVPTARTLPAEIAAAKETAPTLRAAVELVLGGGRRR
ncbi:HAD-IIIA family hydrolase [Actinomadura sp. WAC 06369]|uniref:HAD-IIIA family hydrolase n=1 Tax=Actinomadura sp. WAC 06369 TaxID=2203193 RepID=UPI00131581CF|nr:HAD-IIIA family hydrolase [Actinomadura sp. WAC 06369]